MTYPETYLHVEDCKTGETWISPISPRKKLCLETRVKEWVKGEFCGELRLEVEGGKNIILAKTNIKKNWYSNYKRRAEVAGYTISRF